MTIARNLTRINRKHLQITWEYCKKLTDKLYLDGVLFKGKLYAYALVFEDHIWFYDQHCDVIRKLKGDYNFLFVNIFGKLLFTTRTFLKDQDVMIEQSTYGKYIVTKDGKYFRIKYRN